MTQNSNLKNFENEFIPKINRSLEESIKEAQGPELLEKAMQYSLLANGKRIRPLLTLAVIRTMGKDIDAADIRSSGAVELIHCYSLIHDDLPAMDNSDYRRGKPANHVVFGADIATLAGDGLLTLAFQQLSEANCSSDKKIRLISALSKAAGVCGMVGGQVMDVANVKNELDLEALQILDAKKTGALFRYSVFAGCQLAQANQVQTKTMDDFAKHFGVAFQIYDDLTDAPSAQKTEDEGKNTYVNKLGKTGAAKALNKELGSLRESLKQIGNNQLLNEFLSYFTL